MVIRMLDQSQRTLMGAKEDDADHRKAPQVVHHHKGANGY